MACLAGSATLTLGNLSGGRVMSKASGRFRQQAADELRASRAPGSKEKKAGHVKLAAAYKALAHDEEWLGGEKERSRRKTSRKKK
jgi:hypothetical protein